MTLEALLADGPRADLVVVRAGPRSRHLNWGGSERSYDLLVCAYSSDAPLGDEEARLFIPGRKVEGLSALFRDHPGLLDRYERIAMIDDDIEACPRTLSRCFEIGAEHGLAIWQPALSPESYFSYAAFLQNVDFRLRYVNFIEMMCPFFETGALRRALVLLDKGWETGIDTVWCRQFDDPRRRCAVIDATPVVHSRPVGLSKNENGFAADETYDDHVRRFLNEAGASFHGPVTYAGITRDGTVVSSRFGMFLRSVRILASVSRSPMHVILVYRLILAYLRHIMVRPINDERHY